MSRRGRSWQSVVVALGLVFAGSAQAHVEQRSGPYRVTMGWRDEPPYSGAPNAVEVDVADRTGSPVKVPPGALDVEVAFGGSAAVTSLPLVPSGAVGKLGATIIPTRPGTYAFHVTGTLGSRAVDAQATCSGATFDCVVEPTTVQFPAKEPSNGQLAERVARGLPRAEQAGNRAGTAHGLAVAALVVAGLALAAGGAALARSRGK